MYRSNPTFYAIKMLRSINIFPLVFIIFTAILLASYLRTDWYSPDKSIRIQVIGKHEHPDLLNPTDIIIFKGKYVTTELKTNRLTIFDDLNFTNLHHFDPQKIGKQFHAPHFLAVTPHNSLLISNGWGNSIVEIDDLEGNGWKEFKGVGKQFKAPHGICVDKEGWIYVGDSLNSRLVRFKDLDGKDWQEFSDLDKKISYIRELVCQDGAVWISNSYERRKGLHKGVGANILKLTDFSSGKLEVIHSVKSSNITGILPTENNLFINLFAKRSLKLLNLQKNTDKAKEIVAKDATGMGIPYGTFSPEGKDLFLSTYFGELRNKENKGGILALRPIPSNVPDGFSWTMVNVNNSSFQDDAHLIQVQGGKTILIDAGFPKAAQTELIPYLKSENIKEIDSVYISSTHLDRYGGLEVLIDSGITIRQAWFNRVNEAMCDRDANCSYERYIKLQKRLAKNKTEVKELRTGEIHDLGNGARIKVIAVLNGESTPDLSTNMNDTSTILLAEYSGYKFLFTGYLNPKMGDYLAKHATNIKADVLQVPHHGTDILAPNHFFAKVRPRYAMVSAPSNLWSSQRSMRTRKWFEDHNIPVFVNGDSGNVQVLVKNGALLIHEQFPSTRNTRTLKTSIDTITSFEQLGHVDQMLCKNKTVTINGWAPWEGYNRKQSLFLLGGQKIYNTRMKNEKRVDVAAAFNNPRLENSGFELHFDLSRNCEKEELSFCLLAEDPKTKKFFLLNNQISQKACDKYL